MTVVIPAGSLTQDVTMTIGKLDSASLPAKAFGASFMPYIYWIDTGGVEPLSSASITITLPYDPALIPNGTLETDLTVSYFDGTSWVTLPTVVNTAAHTLTVVTNHFSMWAATIQKANASPTPGQAVTKPVLFPNPAAGSQTHLALPASFDTRVRIFTTSYRLVREIKVGATAAGAILTLDLSDKEGAAFANGVYYVVVTTENSRWAGKMLVLR